MKIETKFNVGDDVYLAKENEIIKGKISEIRIIRTVSINYLSYGVIIVEDDRYFADENKLFKTKQELIDNLNKQRGIT